jgi:SNF2 family DNA or RNA helicase
MYKHTFQLSVIVFHNSFETSSSYLYSASLLSGKFEQIKIIMDFNKINLNLKKISYYRKPDNFTIEEWQYALRKQYAENHHFRIENRGIHPVYSDFDVFNPTSKLFYKVAIRSKDNSANFCECYDFKTNGLGTCKHIEAVFHYIDKKLEKSHLLDEGFRPVYTSIFLDYRADRKVRIRIGSDFSAEYQKLATAYFNENNVLKETSYFHFDEIIRLGKEINENFRCYPDALSYVLEQRENQKRNTIVAEKYLKHIGNGVFDKLINAKLYPYQKEGICFAAAKGRCIIADDMGLGKTIQAIAAAELLRNERGIISAIIVCPTSLKYQWKTEIEKFTGQKALVIEGNYLKRVPQYSNESFYKIVSYNTIINDVDDINATSPDLFILDEAQRIKNFKTRVSQYIKRLKSPYTFVLSGTPLENKLEELYSIMQFVDPFKLGPFWRFMHEHRITDEKGKVKGYQNLNRIGELLSGSMIRRRKKDVLLQLPERMDKFLFVPMTEEQMVVHTEHKEIVARLIQRWQRQGFLNEKDRHSLMINLTMMKMVCDSTYIIDQQTRHDTKIGELMNILDEVFAAGEEKVVVFSQWERMTRLVAQELDSRNVKYEYLHGGVPGDKRGKLFETFTNDPECKVFLSTDAGGVGLNLQAASILINLDIPWNPAVLEQRIARIHRMGQKRNVNIINMVSTGTIEHKMLGTLNFKKGLSEGILDGGDDAIFMEEGKFKVFMNSIENIMEPSSISEGIGTEKEEPEEQITSIENAQTTEISTEPENSNFEPVFLGDDDVATPVTNPQKQTIEEGSPVELVNMGVSFFSRLGETLSNPEATQKLISTLVQTDETDGKTYLKIPIENQKVVENAFAIFAGLLGGLKK